MAMAQAKAAASSTPALNAAGALGACKPWEKPVFGEARGGIRMCLQLVPKSAATSKEKEAPECVIDEATSVPRELFDDLLRRGQDARAGGQHVLVRKEVGQPKRLVRRDLHPSQVC